MRFHLRLLILFSVIITGLIIFSSCSEIDDSTTNSKNSVHPDSWMAESSEDFHARKVGVLGLASCAECHGEDYRGEENVISCYACHGNGPSGHPTEWLTSGDDNFHGEAVIINGWSTCTECHGDDHKGGVSGTSCFTCHNGPSGHPVDWGTYSSDKYHAKGVQKKGWDLTSCQACHGVDYAGGRSGVTCLTCHSNTPESCSTCHGSSSNAAPPKDLIGLSDTKMKSVGAHQAHLSGTNYSVGIACSECHLIPTSLYSPGHIDSELPAEVTFGSIATDNGTLMPVWDGISSCSTVFCHGGFAGGNDKHKPDWTVVGGNETQCGTCHGLPPAAPHPQEPIETVRQCHLCHAVMIDENYTIIDKSKHINGKTDYHD